MIPITIYVFKKLTRDVSVSESALRDIDPVSSKSFEMLQNAADGFRIYLRRLTFILQPSASSCLSINGCIDNC